MKTNMRAAGLEALGAYASIRLGELSAAEKYVRDGAAPAGSRSVIEEALWLWAAGEYWNYGGDRSLLPALAERIERIVMNIAEKWSEETAHWLWTEKRGVFLSNLAICFGALRAIHNSAPSDKAQRTCIMIRERTFQAFMHGNHFVSKQGSDEVWGDIVSAAVPFGLVTAGDLAMLAALERLDAARLGPGAAALLAAYYEENGYPAQARQWLAQAEAEESADSPLLALARALHAERDAEAEGISFDHAPVGGECPYRYEANERSPRTVATGDDIVIGVYVRSDRPLVAVTLAYEVDGTGTCEAKMTRMTGAEDQPFWQGHIPAQSKPAHIRYRFKAQAESGETEVSGEYAFDVHEWRIVDPELAAQDAQQRTTVQFAAEGGKLRAIVRGAGAAGLPAMQALVSPGGNVRKLRLNFPLKTDERLYGMGERFTRLEYRGCELDHYVYNQYKDQGMRTYMPVPLLISSQGYGLFLQSSLYSIFRCGSADPDVLQIEADVHPEQQSLTWWTFTGSPADVLAQFTAVTGRPKLPPKWAFGPWMSSNNWDSQREVDAQLEMNARYEIPATVIVLEQWSDESTFYIFNDAGYDVKPGGERFTYGDFRFPDWGRWPDPKQMVRRIHELGMKVLLWQAPVMKYMDGIAHAQRDEDERYMIERGFGPLRRDGSPYRIPEYEWFRGSLVPDFTNPEAALWWLSKRQYLLDEIGIDGFKTDGGECIYGSDVVFHDGRTGAEMRNEYPGVYVQAFHQFAEKYAADGAITFSRAGYTGAQNIPMHWAGDEKSTFAAFRASIIAGLSAGLSGIPFWGWDLGGFSGEIPSAELYIRSAQMAAFCPVMQYHAESKGQFNMDRTPWNIAERTGRPEALAIYKKYADIRMNLLPYIYEQASISARTGIPLMRTMALAYPGDPHCRTLEMQYMFGDALLVAPITEEGATSVDVYLPQGSWLPLFGGGVQEGGRTPTVAAQLDEIPVFVRENTAVPLHLGLTCTIGDHVGNRLDRYERLVLLVFVTDELAYQFEDDLGTRIDLTASRGKAGVRASVSVHGAAAVTLVFAAVEKAASVQVNGVRSVQAADITAMEAGQWLQRAQEVVVMVPQGDSVIELG